VICHGRTPKCWHPYPNCRLVYLQNYNAICFFCLCLQVSNHAMFTEVRLLREYAYGQQMSHCLGMRWPLVSTVTVLLYYCTIVPARSILYTSFGSSLCYVILAGSNSNTESFISVICQIGNTEIFISLTETFRSDGKSFDVCPKCTRFLSGVGHLLNW
jgi:hypothetical protein